jgi:hypothetical protein
MAMLMFEMMMMMMVMMMMMLKLWDADVKSMIIAGQGRAVVSLRQARPVLYMREVWS